MEKGAIILNKSALILEGGGMRGLYTAGVLDFFIDKGIYFRNCYGVSAGATQGCSYLSKQKGRAYRIFTNYMNDGLNVFEFNFPMGPILPKTTVKIKKIFITSPLFRSYQLFSVSQSIIDICPDDSVFTSSCDFSSGASPINSACL